MVYVRAVGICAAIMSHVSLVICNVETGSWWGGPDVPVTVDDCRPAQFEAEGIDGISSGQQVDLRTVPKAVHSVQQETSPLQLPPALIKPSSESEEEEDEEHESGCACWPGGGSIVFRVY